MVPREQIGTRSADVNRHAAPAAEQALHPLHQGREFQVVVRGFEIRFGQLLRCGR